MSNYELIFKGKFKKDLKKFLNNSSDYGKIKETLFLLQNFGTDGIPSEMYPHKLKGQYQNNWECHIKPDLLIIWFQIDVPKKQIQLVRIGSHSELFK